MFKDYDKYLTASLKVYLFVLICTIIMKMVGLDYFGLDLDNPALLNLNNFVMKYHLENVWYAVTMYINVYIVISITTNDNSKKLKLFVLIFMPLIIFFQSIKTQNIIFVLLDYTYVFILSIIYLFFTKQKIKKVNIKNYILFTIINIFIQALSLILRNSQVEILYHNFIANFIYNLDYFIMILMIHKIYFRKEEKDLCQMVVYSSLQKLTLLKQSLIKLRRKSQNKRNKKTVKTKPEKISYIIFMILYLLWNLFTLVVIIFIAMINDTVIECIFIIFSFWISKSVFGKAFHLKSVVQCFIVSNITYYVLNRITTPLGISIIIPIMLGVGLSYVTSKLVKKTYKPLYKGMSEQLFEETIINVVDKDSDKYKICYDYFIKKKSALSLSYKYNYSEAGIRKIKDRVNDKIKRLN